MLLVCMIPLDGDDSEDEWSAWSHCDCLEEYHKLERDFFLQHDSPHDDNVLALDVEENLLLMMIHSYVNFEVAPPPVCVGYVVNFSINGIDTRHAHELQYLELLTFDHVLGYVDVCSMDKGFPDDSTRYVSKLDVLQSLEVPDANIPCHIDKS